MTDRLAIALLVSLDTKAPEATFLREALIASGVDVVVVDFGTGAPGLAPDVAADEIAAAGGAALEDLRARRDRAETIEAMMAGAAAWAASAYAGKRIVGLLSLGGSGGTAVGTAAMRALPFGVPKIMVSTVAASDTRAYLGAKDIVMVNSVVDFAGINPLSAPVLRNAAAAAAAMVRASAEPLGPTGSNRLVAASQFGVTTAVVEEAARLLAERGLNLVPFHATGTGGRTMESLVADGLFEAVLDLTTTEWADEVAGGNLSAGPERLEAAGRLGLPQVVAPGALDMANFFMVPVPDKFSDRTIFVHNANVSLMRTTPDENREIGRRIAEKLNAATGPVTVLFPEKGISALDEAGKPFFDPEADAALREALERHLAPHVTFLALDLHINDKAFAAAAVDALCALIETKGAPNAPPAQG